jgi:hypothetical protein
MGTMRSLAFLIVAGPWFGCLDASDQLGSTSQHAESENKLATNKLATNKLATNKLATNKLATNSLDSTKLTALEETSEILSTADGREVYSYLVSCALAGDTTIEKTDVIDADTNALAEDDYCTAGHCVFSGSLGLADEWRSRKLSSKGQGWVSACMFARINVHDTAEGVSLRGPHASLTVTPDEAFLYTVQEGAFYGNMFTKDDEPIAWFACMGAGQAAGEFGGLVLRDCTEPDPDNAGLTLCGFNYAGECADYSPEFPSPYACRKYDEVSGIYSPCFSSSGLRRWPRETRYSEVITVYVSP